ncbi:beta-ketoacyl synthase N-terminal-like domain-containing protein [Nocardia sp. 2YAB30]|uniref:beta-ketoacyl synthase N-terminal-like domain-containing protein n=1 Tax=Nocardia sp. 2YAB30 TaxID=3233022 RepID=UPI003F9690D8
MRIGGGDLLRVRRRAYQTPAPDGNGSRSRTSADRIVEPTTEQSGAPALAHRTSGHLPAEPESSWGRSRSTLSLASDECATTASPVELRADPRCRACSTPELISPRRIPRRKPFSGNADGTVRGEGVAVLVLAEELALARYGALAHYAERAAIIGRRPIVPGLSLRCVVPHSGCSGLRTSWDTEPPAMSAAIPSRSS